MISSALTWMGNQLQQCQHVLRFEFHGRGSLFAIRELRMCVTRREKNK